MKNRGRLRQVILWSLTIIMMSQCSPYAGKNLLNFFFDGVPESDSVGTELSGPEQTPSDSLGPAQELLAQQAPSRILHDPYGEGECASCHNALSLGTMVEAQPGLCYLCHEDLSEGYAYLHGPVAGGYCTACHDPHMSESPQLLRMEGDRLCFYCHAEEDVLKNEMHQDLEGMLCLDCHNPHGGEDKYIFQ